MSSPRIVLDTCVFASALRSRRGASFRLLSAIGDERFTICVSVPLVLEYEAVGKRIARSVGLRHEDIEIVVDYLCKIADCREIHFLRRPMLKDPGDEMVLEIAVEADADFIVTHNLRHFAGCEAFGVRAVTPQEFLRLLEINQ